MWKGDLHLLRLQAPPLRSVPSAGVHAARVCEMESQVQSVLLSTARAASVTAAIVEEATASLAVCDSL